MHSFMYNYDDQGVHENSFYIKIKIFYYKPKIGRSKSRLNKMNIIGLQANF